MKEQVILNGTQLMEREPDPNNYLIEGMLWENQHIMLLAKEKVGKSIFALQMACALSCGESFLDEYEVPEPMEILYIQTESTLDETIERLRSMTGVGGVGWDPSKFHLFHTHSIALDVDAGYAAVVELITKSKLHPRVIFIDPLYMSMIGGLTNELDARKCSRNIRKLGEHFQSAINVVHHEHRGIRKKKDNDKYIEEGDNSIMGSFVWKAFPNHIIRLQQRPDTIRTLTCETQRSNRVIRDMQLVLYDNPLMYRLLNTADHAPYVDSVYEHMVKFGKKCAGELIAEMGLSASAVRKSLSYLFKAKRICKLNVGKRPTYYEAIITAEKL